MVRRKASSSSASSAPLINLLKSWSIQHKFQDDTYVSGLLEALETEENLEVWASLDPLDYLPTPSDKSNDIFLRFNLGLTIVRNALVFLPVALTWYAISKASSAFAVYTANNTLTVSNFLDFWENGYGVLSKEWSLSHIATLDFQIIIVIILMTIAISIIERILRVRGAKSNMEIDDAKFQLAIAIKTYLFDHQRITDVTMNQSLGRAVKQLQDSSKSLNQTSKELLKLVKSLPSDREILREIKRIKSGN
jgi:methyl-accepting chemotaxis protein